MSRSWPISRYRPRTRCRRPCRHLPPALLEVRPYPVLGYATSVPSTQCVDKAIYTQEQRRLSALLRDLRAAAGLRQIDVAHRLGVPQSFVSKYEAGERRLDLVELRQVCEALGLGLRALIDRFEAGSNS